MTDRMHERPEDDGAERELDDLDSMIGDGLGGNTVTGDTVRCACGYLNSISGPSLGTVSRCQNPDEPDHLIDDWPVEEDA